MGQIETAPSDEKPREKLLNYGQETLSPTELIAILLRTGTKGNDVFTLAKQIVEDLAKNNLRNLAAIDRADLEALGGMGEVKATTLLAAFELGKRIGESPRTDIKQINESKVVVDILGDIASKDQEEFYALYLNSQNMLIKRQLVSIGGLNSTMVDTRVILSNALRCNAVSMIVAHNHPSGCLTPSQEDKKLTIKIQEGCKAVGLRLLDHIIIAQVYKESYENKSKVEYYSFKDHELQNSIYF